MKQYKTIAALKGDAKTHMFGNYGPAIGAYILMKLILFSISVIVSAVLPEGTVGQIFYYAINIVITLLSGVLIAGCTYIYLNIASGNPVYANMIFYGLKNCAEKAIVLQGYLLGMELLVCAPLIFLLIMYRMSSNTFMMILVGVGAIIALLGIILINLVFMPVFFLIHDFPDYTPKMIIETSMNIMRGNVGRLFLLNLSIVPLQLLEILSLGIGALWVETYKYEVLAEFFLDIMRPAENIEVIE